MVTRVGRTATTSGWGPGKARDPRAARVGLSDSPARAVESQTVTTRSVRSASMISCCTRSDSSCGTWQVPAAR